MGLRHMDDDDDDDDNDDDDDDDDDDGHDSFMQRIYITPIQEAYSKDNYVAYSALHCAMADASQPPSGTDRRR